MTMHRRTLLIGAALILVTNAIVLGGVAYNRNGDPDSTLVLTQRELTLPHHWGMHRENSGIALQVAWRTLGADAAVNDYQGHWSAPVWLDQAKMAALGFDISALSARDNRRDRYGQQLAKEVLLVLEYNGALHIQALEVAQTRLARAQALLAARPDDAELQSKVKQAQEALNREQNENSRLFAVDAGLDLKGLRAKYADRARYLIVRGKIRPIYSAGTAPGGQIESLSIERIHVPTELMHTLERTPAPAAGKYEVTVQFGRRLEPWITAVGRPAH